MTQQSFKHCDHGHTDYSTQKTLVGSWFLEVVWSFPEVPTQSLHSWHRLQIKYHKPLYNQFDDIFIFDPNYGLKFGMWNFIKKVIVHCKCALEMAI